MRFHSDSQNKIVINFDYDFLDIKKIDESIDYLNSRFNVDIIKTNNFSQKKMSDNIYLFLYQEYEIKYENQSNLCNCLIEIGRILS